MVGLVDVAPVGEQVLIRGELVDCCGLGIIEIAALLARFPELMAMMDGRGTFDAASFAGTVGKDALAAVLAAGTGNPGDERAEAVAKTLGIDDEAQLLEAIMRLTMPRGPGPFMETLERARKMAGGAPSGKRPATKSPRQRKR